LKSGPLNAVVRVLADEARAAAVLATSRWQSGKTLARCTACLHGEGKHHMAACPQPGACPALAKAVAPADAPVVERMRAAAPYRSPAPICPTWRCGVHTDSSLHGLTRNPGIRVVPRRLERRPRPRAASA